MIILSCFYCNSFGIMLCVIWCGNVHILAIFGVASDQLHLSFWVEIFSWHEGLVFAFVLCYYG